MFDNKGKGTFIVVLITMIITMLFCYVIVKLTVYSSILNTGISYSTKDFSKLAAVKNIIDTTFLYEYDEDELMDATISGMLEGLNDPYATYYNKSAFESFNTQTEGEYEGIGIYVSYDTERNMPIIITPIVGSPAAAAGLLPGDYIEYVGNLQAVNVSYDELIDAIKGKVGTKVKIGIIRYKEDNSYDEIELEVERKKIDINPITEEVYEDNIGYIKMTSFDEVAYKGFKEKYEDLINNKNVKGLIIDLRNN